MSRTIRDALVKNLESLEKLSPDERVNQRYEKFRRMGYVEGG